jgi:hypothetical protein
MIQIFFLKTQENEETQEDNNQKIYIRSIIVVMMNPKVVDLCAKDSNNLFCIFFYHIKTSITTIMICYN